MYKLTKDPDVVLDTDSGTIVPRQSSLWHKYEEWLAAGNTPDPAQSADEARAGVLATINTACENAIAALQAIYPASEVLSWTKQEAEARSYVADPGAATPLLDALAEARGIDKAELARRIILKADAFAQYSGTAIGKRQALEDALNALPAAATVEQIAAIAW